MKKKQFLELLKEMLNSAITDVVSISSAHRLSRKESC